MRTIKISESQREAICSELARLVDQFKMYDNVKCIYVIPYESAYSKDKKLSIEIVREMNKYRYLEWQIDSYCLNLGKIDSVAKYGVQLIPTIGDVMDYQGEQYHMLRKGFLHNATIIYDKDGSFTRLQKDEKDDLSLLFNNRCEFVPPLTDNNEEVYLAPEGYSKKLVRKEK